VPIYADQHVRILENPSAFPPAWMVHAATQAAPEPESEGALAPLASGQVDGRRTALLKGPLPPLEAPPDPALDQALVREAEADRLDVHTSSASAGLLVLSEIYYAAWHAYVDGQPAHLYLADGALRAVALPAGEHEVQLRYESSALALGLLISCLASLLLAGLGLGALIELKATRRRPEVSKLQMLVGDGDGID
jgi:hypothetical protein